MHLCGRGYAGVVDSADGTFQLDLNRIEAAINCRTKAVLINSPNNPSGVVYKHVIYRQSAVSEVPKRLFI